MDGGVADTTRANTTVLTQAVNRQSWGEQVSQVRRLFAALHSLGIHTALHSQHTNTHKRNSNA